MYQPPPAPTRFDPAPRPFRWTLEEIQLESGNELLRYPAPEDESEYLDLAGALGIDPRQQLFSHKTTRLDRLRAYDLLTRTIAPGDPETGGLPPDEMTDGGAVLHYFDFSDSKTPRRKKVFYQSRGGTVEVLVAQYTGKKGGAEHWGGEGWEDEPFDFERDWKKEIGPAFFQALAIGSSVLIGWLTGMPGLGAAFGSVIGKGAAAAFSGKPPDPFQAFAQLAQFGDAIDLGSIAADGLKKNDVLHSLYGTMQRSSIPDFVGKLKGTVERFAGSMPRIDLDAFKGVIPPQMDAMVDPIARLDAIASFGKGVEAFHALRSGDMTAFYSLRKNVPSDVATFDLTVAALWDARKQEAMAEEMWRGTAQAVEGREAVFRSGLVLEAFAPLEGRRATPERQATLEPKASLAKTGARVAGGAAAALAVFALVRAIVR